MICLLDMDVLRYRIGFACEYELFWYSNMEEPVRGIKAWKQYREDHPEDNARDVFTDKVIEPVEYCLHSCKMQIEHILTRCKTNKLQGFMTGKGNFREEIATIKPYKGNRPDRKPVHYDALTEYLTRTWKGITVDGIEADDALAMHQSGTTCIASIDKDLHQIPKKHYDFYHDKRFVISEAEADRNLYAQIIAGDSTDNIGGVPRVGLKTAYKLLRNSSSIEYYAKTALEQYQRAFDKNPKAFGGLEPLDALTENARLVYLLRYPEDKWEFPL